jgi:hypothetical protein
MSKRDSFRYAFEYLYFPFFDEPNLSLAPSDKEVFRLFFTGFNSCPVFITLSDQKITVKKGNREIFFEYTDDTMRLSPLERKHFFLLEHRYPLEEYKKKNKANLKLVTYIDSMIHLYPMLLDPKYYFNLVIKVTPPNKTPFTFTTKTILLSKKQYGQLIGSIDSSGYWKLPYKIKCAELVADGHYFFFRSEYQI